MRRFYKDDLIGPYRVIRLLGKGGMGNVYEVVHRKLGVRYALKTFVLEHGKVELLRKKFLAEGKVLARLRHPNLVRVYDLDCDEATNTPYFTMDEILNSEGNPQTLDDVMSGSVDEATLVEWFEQLASALDYIHENGIVHRDIKPSNILIDDTGSVMLMDFGVARYLNDGLKREISIMPSSSRDKRPDDTMRMIIGTRTFMSPEVKSGHPAGVAADAYSLGLVFFWLLTGVWYRGEENELEMLKNFDRNWWSALPWLLNKTPALRPSKLSEAVALLHEKAPVSQEASNDDGAEEPEDADRSHHEFHAVEPVVPIEETPLFVWLKEFTQDWNGLVWWGFGVLCATCLCVTPLLPFVWVAWVISGVVVLKIIGQLLGRAFDAYDRWLWKDEQPKQSNTTIVGPFLTCPFCHAPVSAEEEMKDGQHVRCPYCDAKSQYDGKIKTLVDIGSQMTGFDISNTIAADGIIENEESGEKANLRRYKKLPSALRRIDYESLISEYRQSLYPEIDWQRRERRKFDAIRKTRKGDDVSFGEECSMIIITVAVMLFLSALISLLVAK